MTPDDEMFQFLMKFFRKGEIENSKFFHRLNELELRGKRVLEFGCGTGSLAVYMVEKLGAEKVVAVDIERTNIAFARANLKANFPEFIGRLEYWDCSVDQIPGKEGFDFVVSKDCFEHVIPFEDCLRQLVRLLKQGGALLAGWGPLYYSARGGHALSHVPYDHLLLPDAVLVRRFNRQTGKNCKTVWECGLNKFHLADYLKIIHKFPLHKDFVKIKTGLPFPFPLLGASFGRIPYLGDLVVHNVYMRLTKMTDVEQA